MRDIVFFVLGLAWGAVVASACTAARFHLEAAEPGCLPEITEDSPYDWADDA